MFFVFSMSIVLSLFYCAIAIVNELFVIINLKCIKIKFKLLNEMTNYFQYLMNEPLEQKVFEYHEN